MSVASDRALILDRPCSSCAHSVRHRGEHKCAKSLIDAHVSAESIRYHLSSVDDVATARRHGLLLSRLFLSCGREGRYWRSRS